MKLIQSVNFEIEIGHFQFISSECNVKKKDVVSKKKSQKMPMLYLQLIQRRNHERDGCDIPANALFHNFISYSNVVTRLHASQFRELSSKFGEIQLRTREDPRTGVVCEGKNTFIE